jgi:hypothetical protein
MKFGGHETFFLRPGWLTKGLHVTSRTIVRPFFEQFWLLAVPVLERVDGRPALQG